MLLLADTCRLLSPFVEYFNCFSHFTMTFLLLSGQSGQKGWIGEKKHTFLFYGWTHHKHKSGHTRGSYAVAQVRGAGGEEWSQTRSINNQQGDKLQCLNLNPGRHNGHDEEEWGKECKSRDCVCVCVTGGTLSVSASVRVCVFTLMTHRSKMHSGKEQRRRKLLPHKV